MCFFFKFFTDILCFDFSHFFLSFSSISFGYILLQSSVFFKALYSRITSFASRVGLWAIRNLFLAFFFDLHWALLLVTGHITPGRILWHHGYHPLQLSHSTISPFSSHLSQCSPHMYTKQTYNTKQNLTQHESCEKCFFIGRRRKTIASILAK